MRSLRLQRVSALRSLRVSACAVPFTHSGARLFTMSPALSFFGASCGAVRLGRSMEPVMRNKHACALMVCVLSLWGGAPTAFAQAAPATPCAAVLTSPTRDTVPLVVVLEMHAYDTRRALPVAYQRDFGAAVKRHLVLPRSLGADLYEAREESGRTAHLVMRGNYKATITADGRVVDGATTGGDRNRAFDDAVVAALS